MTANRSHSLIVASAVEKYGSRPALQVALGGGVSRQNVVDWERRDLIPAERWTRFVDLDLTSLAELAAHVAAPASEQAA